MKKLISVLLVLGLVLSLAACNGAESGNASSEPAESGAAGGTRTVTDHLGREVELPAEINRVVICDIYPLPSVLSVFFDSAEKIVGMPAPAMAAAKGGLLGELYPEILTAETGFIDGTNVNIEELLKLEPDLVFVNAGNKASIELMENAKIPAVAISAGKWKYDPLATLNGWIGTLSQVFPENDRREVLNARTAEAAELVESRTSGLSEEERESVFFLFQYTDTNLLSAGNPSFGSAWAAAIGAGFVVTDTTEANSLPVDMEQIYAWNPSVIFITNFTSAAPEDLYKNTIGDRNWSVVDAVENGRVYKMPLGMYRSYTAGVDAPIALLWMAKAVYPDLFADVDIRQETRDYYSEVFGITLTDEQADRIFSE